MHGELEHLVGCWDRVCCLMPSRPGAQITMQPDRPADRHRGERAVVSARASAITFSGKLYYPAGRSGVLQPERDGPQRGLQGDSALLAEDARAVRRCLRAGRSWADAAVRAAARRRHRRNRRQHRAILSGRSATTSRRRGDADPQGARAADAPAQSSTSDRRYEPPSPASCHAVLAEQVAASGRARQISPSGSAHDGAQTDRAQRVLHQLPGPALVQQRPAVLLDTAELHASGEYHGFPVYRERRAERTTIYVAVAGAAERPADAVLDAGR